MNVSITDTTITDGLGGGIYAYSFDATSAPLNLNLSGIEMNNMGNDALETIGTTVYLADYTIDGTRYGINSTDSTLNLSDVDITNSSVFIDDHNTDTTADTITITNAGANGLRVSGGTLLLSNA